ncbi:MAG TPA: hypothetical protein VFM42_07885 [Sphingomicrobium sp.]|nr:hypothetical protein [Sphingomicrobium sp.]
MIAAALLAAWAVTAANSPVAGTYEAQQMEVGAALELRDDGHFRYQLDYGAVSEQAEGEWTFDGKAVRLTTRPKPLAPAFELVSDDPAPAGELFITAEYPGLDWSDRLDAIATDLKSGEKGLVTADRDGRIDSNGRIIGTIEPLVPVYGTAGGRFSLSADRGHRLRLRFHANDLGTADFDSAALPLDGGDLLLDRYDMQIRFIRIGP